MESWGVLVWNMALMSPGRHRAADNLAYLQALVEKHSIEIALLNEATVHDLESSNAEAARAGLPQPFAFSSEGTKGRDFWTDEHGVRKPYDRHRWSVAVMSRSGPVPLGERDVRATSISESHPRRPDVPFTNSRPGSWIAATVAVGKEKVTCISMYGLIEELTDASMHRALSDVSPIFSDPSHNELVLLGGDFNLSTAAKGTAGERARIVLERIRAYGLKDCLVQWREDHDVPPLAGCPCGEGDQCRHTLTRLIPSKPGERVPWQERVPYQDDYLFASEALAAHLDSVTEISPDEWEAYSDHSPIIATFRAG